MKRTRKWEFVEQEASRLAALGLSLSEIATRLGVNKSTVSRWMSSGKLNREGRAKRPKRPAARFRVKPGQTPAQWAASVRKTFALDATDEQLVTLGEMALVDSYDMAIAPSVRHAAAGRFQAIVRQLALLPGRNEEKPADVPAPAASEPVRPTRVPRTGPDPRTLFLAKTS